jgi:hypothetical protein
MVRNGRGQAAVESVGVTVAIALLMAALAVWMAGNLRPSGPPPDVVGRVADPLGVSAQPIQQAWSPDDVPTWMDREAAGRGSRPIGRFLRRIGHGIRRGVAIEQAFERGWHRGIKPVVIRRVRAFVEDPVGTAGSVDLAHTGVGLIQRMGRLPAYIRMLNSMSAEEAAERLGQDLGETTGEVGMDVLEEVVTHKAGGLLRGPGRTPSPPTGGRGAPRP